MSIPPPLSLKSVQQLHKKTLVDAWHAEIIAENEMRREEGKAPYTRFTLMGTKKSDLKNSALSMADGCLHRQLMTGVCYRAGKFRGRLAEDARCRWCAVDVNVPFVQETIEHIYNECPNQAVVARRTRTCGHHITLQSLVDKPKLAIDFFKECVELLQQHENEYSSADESDSETEDEDEDPDAHDEDVMNARDHAH